MLTLKCPVCKRVKKGESYNECVLELEHHPECDINKGLPVPMGSECWEDDKFS